MALSIFSSVGLASAEQIVDRTANETFSFPSGTSDTMLVEIDLRQKVWDWDEVKEDEASFFMTERERLESRLQSLRRGLRFTVGLQQDRPSEPLPGEQAEQDNLAHIQATQIRRIIEDET